MGIKTKKKKKFRKWQKNSGAIFEKGGVIMGWENILKRAQRGIGLKDIKTLNYVLRNGDFRTVEAIMDEIYNLIVENKKLGYAKIVRMEGRPRAIRFAVSKKELKRHMTKSPAYESRDTGNKTRTGQPIKEYRYIGE